MDRNKELFTSPFIGRGPVMAAAATSAHTGTKTLKGIVAGNFVVL
jgi:hypothetical protein